MSQLMPERTYTYLFFFIVLAYCVLYAPYGINVTDGGFLTGLGWQVLCGKTLYHDILYVRPPLPVWLRALELAFLPDGWSILGERYIFYLKVALFSWLAADLLTKGTYKWILAAFGFIISVHSYPACAWHTIDGILFAVLSIWCYNRQFPVTWQTLMGSMFAGVFFCAAMLCKQSFYPLVVAFPLLFIWWNHPQKWPRLLVFTASVLLCTGLFFNYLYQNNLLEGYLSMTGASASGGQALQHGFLDYLRIKPALALFSGLLLMPVVWWFWKRKNTETAATTWSLWLALVLGSYVFDFWKNEAFTAPFSQSRILFLTGVLYAAWLTTKGLDLRHWRQLFRSGIPENTAHLWLLLSVSWSAAVSWGYNLPILLATPWVFAAMEISRDLWEAHHKKTYLSAFYLINITALFLIGRFSYEYVYRDGQRSAMTENLGVIFPKLQGVYSSPETAALYRDLDMLSRRYGPEFAVLPAFPQAHFLTGTCSPLPLDWIVKREMNGDNTLVLNALKNRKTVFFIEKSFAEKINNDPELTLTRQLMQQGKMLEETPHFWIVRHE